MNTFLRIASIAIVAAAVSPTAWGAGKASPAEQAFERELALCMSGKSQQDRATCLKEARAAYQESRRNGLTTPGDAQLSANATARCGAQPEADRAACMDRITGAGSADGSVNGGGIIRRSETTTR